MTTKVDEGIPWDVPLSDAPASPASENQDQRQSAEAAWVAWGNFAIPVRHDLEDGSEGVVFFPASVTIREGAALPEVIERVSLFAEMAFMSGWLPVTEKQFRLVDASWFVERRDSGHAAQDEPAWTPPARETQETSDWAPSQAQRQQSQQPAAYQQDDNTFVVDKLVVTNKVNTATGEPYTEYLLVGPRYPKYGVRIYPEKLEEALPGWSGAPPGTHVLRGPDKKPAKYKATFSWDTKLGKDGVPRPKNVYALELI